ncbi:phage tail length tape measure family protein [Pseudomonas sp. DSV-1]|uniref:phage tail length tape measure family protein n=1 Tax=Pseudomonas sp. DSV-1 TaxID=3112250 RepID=UPI002DBC5DF2|nr:phage tail length tape measure family protein [Pseudomonas sp. DSV-1]MEC4239155.1 phage tail length tape measure family protein [Pseudomonas sp. DSV-1]
MAEQKSRLVLEIDSRDAEQKAEDVRKALGALEDAGIRVKPAMDKAGAGLDGVGKSATKASQNLGQLDKSSDGAGKATVSSSEKYAEASARLLAMATSSLQASDYVKSLTASTSAASVSFDAASDKIRSITSLSARLRAESDALAGSTDKASVSTRNASVATDLQAKELADLLGKINPTVAALGRLDDMQSKLGQFRKAGLIDTETFKDYSTRLDSTRQGLSAFDEGLSKTGISARQTETALRQLPSQFTDIFTSLAAGQNPLLVLLQQGGQIKDSFGGIGNTVDVLGGKVKGFFSSIAGSSAGIVGAGAVLGELASKQEAVAEGSEAAADGLGGMADSANTAADASKNAKEAADALGLTGAPVSAGLGLIIAAATASAAALALMIYGYNKGSQEADAFNKALILTGNFAGTSSDQLADLAMKVSAVNGTTGQAAEILAGLASSGKIASESFETIANAAIAMEDATGKSVDATIAEFMKISKDPVSAAKELNDQYHFLTASVYSQIAALKEQGDTIGAAELLTKTYSDTVQDRSRQITDNLGTIERAWKGIKDAAAGALDATFNVGRTLTMEQQAQEIRERLSSNRGSGGRLRGLGYETRDIKKDQAALAYLELQIDAEKTKNTYLGVQRKIQDDAVNSQIKVDALTKSSLTNEQKRTEAVKEYRKQLDNIRKANPDDARLNQGVIDKNIANINEKFKDVKTPKDKPYTEDAGQKALDAARQTQAVLIQQNASLSAQGIVTEKVGAQAQALIRWEQQLSDIKNKKTLTADQKSLLATQDLITAQLKKNAGLEREAEIIKGIQLAQKDQVQLLTLTGQLRAANGLKSSLDDAAQMAEYERQGNTEAMKRLETMIKIRDINLQASQKPGTVEGVSQAPTAPGLDASLGGASSEIDRLNESASKLDEWRATELAKQQAYLDLKAINEETHAARVANIDQQAQNNRIKIEQAKNQALLIGTSDFFGNMSALSQSGNKKLAAIGKAAAIAQATIATYKSANDSYSALAAIPIVGPALGAAAAAAAIISGMANVASISGIGFSDGGYTGVGGKNEYAGAVHKGEVVWSQADISRFGGVAAVESLRKGNVSPIGVARSVSAGSSAGKSSGTSTPTPLTVNLIENPSKAGQVERGRNSDGSESLTLFAAQIRAGGNEASDTFESVYGLKRSPG